MNALEVLQEVHTHGGQLRAERGALHVTAPTPLPPALMAALREHKPALLTLLAPDAEQDDPARKIASIDTMAGTWEVATLRRHLAALLPAIRAGRRRGLAAHLDRVPAELVRALLAGLDPARMTHEEYRARLERAGEAVTLAGLVAAYRARLRWLQEQGADIFPDAAALELALLMGDDPPREGQP